MTTTAVRVRKLAGALGAEMTGVDLSRLEEDRFGAVRDALLEHIVVVVPDQDLRPESLKEFGARFGPLLTHPAVQGQQGHPEVLPLVNRGKEQTITEVWHSDITCEQRPPSISVLHARVVPAYGGDTMWANQYLAYDRLSEGMKRMLEGMEAVHSGFGLEAVHPAVRTHPVTGRRAMFVNAGFTRRFRDMSTQESLPLLRQLVAHATAPDLTFRHRWSRGDVVMWDNRCVMHYGIHDYGDQERVMHRVTVEGDRPVR